jgi:hypothetical protein
MVASERNGTDTPPSSMTAHISAVGPAVRLPFRGMSALGAELPMMRSTLDGGSCPECMDRLPFASEVVVSDSLICIRPVDRLAGRGLDGSTHAPLISLAARLRSNHSGHQILGAAFNPFHATPQSRTGSRGAA